MALSVQVYFDDSQANVIFKELLKRHGPTPVKKAMVRGINDAVSARIKGFSGKTPLRVARDAIYQQANLKKGRINRGTKVLKRDKAKIQQGKPVGRITANQYRISLTSYGARLRGGKKNKRVEVATRRGGSRQTMAKAFIRNAGRSKSLQVLQRKPGVGRLPIRRRSGPSLGFWMQKRKTERAVRATATKFVPDRIAFHMQRELNGTANRARAARSKAIAHNRAARAAARAQQQRARSAGRAVSRAFG